LASTSSAPGEQWVNCLTEGQNDICLPCQLVVECCRDDCLSGSSVSDHRVLGHHPDKSTSPPIAQFGRTATSRKSLGGYKLLPFKKDGRHCVLGDLQCCRYVLVPCPRSVPQHTPVSEICTQYLQPHGLVFTLTCTVNCGTLYRQVCGFPKHVKSIEFTTGELQSSYRNISRMINGNRMHLSSISSLIAKGLNSYVNKVFLFLFLIRLQTFLKPVFALSLWSIVCRLLRQKHI
jgi:hypothetical protein